MITNSEVFLKDVFDIDETIERYGNKIFLISGVGSGKSTWVKEVLCKKGSVLFLTSRRVKVEADVKTSCFSDVIKFNTTDNQTLITNAKLAALIRGISRSNSRDIDEFVNCFDYFVIDEVHSIVTDSLFADSCPEVLAFIEYLVEKRKTIVAMTGTPEPIIEYFRQHKWKILDYRKKCRYVHPWKVVLTTKDSVDEIIHRYWGKRKIIYFVNRTSTIIEISKRLIHNPDIDENSLATIVSKSKEADFFKVLKSQIPSHAEAIQKASNVVYSSIVETQKIPDDCKILFSTSAMKEGIDIENTETVLICENHILTNLIQFLGRARSDGCIAYIIENVADHPISPRKLICEYAVKAEVKAANSFLKNRIELDTNTEAEKEKTEFISYVKEKNPYIYFDYIRNEFRAFKLRLIEELRIADNWDWKNELTEYCFEYSIEFQGVCNMQKLMREVLIKAMEEKRQIYKEEQQIVLNALKWAYRIENKQPTKINEELKKANAPIRIHAATGTKIDNRNKRYWMIISEEV